MTRKRFANLIVVVVLMAGVFVCARFTTFFMALGCISETYQSELCWNFERAFNLVRGIPQPPPYRPPSPTRERAVPTPVPAQRTESPAYPHQRGEPW